MGGRRVGASAGAADNGELRSQLEGMYTRNEGQVFAAKLMCRDMHMYAVLNRRRIFCESTIEAYRVISALHTWFEYRRKIDLFIVLFFSEVWGWFLDFFQSCRTP